MSAAFDENIAPVHQVGQLSFSITRSLHFPKDCMSLPGSRAELAACGIYHSCIKKNGSRLLSCALPSWWLAGVHPAALPWYNHASLAVQVQLHAGGL